MLQNINKEKKAKKEKRDARNAARKEAQLVLKELVDKSQDPKYKKALATIAPKLYGITKKGSGVSAADKFVAYVNERGQVKEDVIFREFKYGRKDCAVAIRNHLRKSEPEKRVWISFNPETEMYKVEGKGPNAPGNWEGYVPVQENAQV